MISTKQKSTSELILQLILIFTEKENLSVQNYHKVDISCYV